MKIYIHEGKGFYIGSCVIVMTEDEETAINLILKELSNMGLEEDINITSVKEVAFNSIIYANNGDY
jgi:hypothetical protein